MRQTALNSTGNNQDHAAGSGAPFGAETPRGRGPLLFWGALYLVWLVALIWMAAFYA